MSYTLDQLLDETGINEITGEHLNKQASTSERQDLSKLAERCRRAVDATPDERVSSEQQALVEKTAAVAIIGKTLAEIRAIDDSPPDQVKTASTETPDAAVFIKAALDAGHTPEQISEFIEKNAIFGRLARRAKIHYQTGRVGRAVQKEQKAGRVVGKRDRQLQESIRRLESAPEAERAATLARLRANMGSENAYALVSAAGGKNWKGMEAFKELKKVQPKKPPGTPGAPSAPGGVGVNVGGRQVGLSSEQMQKIKKPALYLGGGALAHRAITGPKQESGGKGRPVIITG